MDFSNSLAMYNKIMEQFDQTCADTTDPDDTAADDTTVEND